MTEQPQMLFYPSELAKTEEKKNYIYHHPDISSGFRLLSTFAKLLEMQAGYLGWDRLQESVGGIGINSGEQEALILIGVGVVTILGNVYVDMRANASVSAETTLLIIIEKDPNKERGIDIKYQDLRGNQSPPVQGNGFLGKMKSLVDCLELSFEDQNEDPTPFRTIFYNQEGLNKAFDHARLAVKHSREDGQPIDPNSGRLVRYDREKAVELGIIGEEF